MDCYLRIDNEFYHKFIIEMILKIPSILFVVLISHDLPALIFANRFEFACFGVFAALLELLSRYNQ